MILNEIDSHDILNKFDYFYVKHDIKIFRKDKLLTSPVDITFHNYCE